MTERSRMSAAWKVGGLLVIAMTVAAVWHIISPRQSLPTPTPPPLPEQPSEQPSVKPPTQPPLPLVHGEVPLKHLWQEAVARPQECPKLSISQSEFVTALGAIEGPEAKLDFIADPGNKLADAAGCDVVAEYLDLAKNLRRAGLYRQGRELYLNHILPLTTRQGWVEQTAAALGNMAVLEGFSGNLAKALEAQKASLHLWTLLDQRISWAKQVLGFAYVQFHSGQHEETLENLAKILDRFEIAGDNENLAAALTLSARAEVSLSVRLPSQRRLRLNRARNYLDRALPLRYEPADLDVRDRGLVSTLDALGRVLIESNERLEAERILNEALEVIQRRWARTEVAPHAEAKMRLRQKLRQDRQAVMANLAEVLLLNQDADGALKLAERASSYLLTAGSPGLPELNERINLLYLQARAHRALQQSEAALDHARRLVAGLEVARVGGKVLLAPFFDIRRQYFDVAIDLLASAKLSEEAFDLAELLRARGLLDRLVTTAQPWQLSTQNTVLADRDRRLRAELAELSAGPGVGREEVSGRLFELLDVEQQIRSQAGVKSAQPLRRHQVDEWLEPGTLVMVFWLAHERNWLWLIEPGREDLLKSLPSYCEGFGSWATDLRRAIGDHQPFKIPNLIEATADCVFPNREVAEAVGRAQRLMIVADNDLSSVPIAALPHPIHSDEKLIEVLPVSFVPSLSILAALRQRSVPKESDDRRQLVLIAAPEYVDSPWDALPGARREAEGIRSHMTPDLELLGTDASLPRLRNETLANARIIHFATHADLNKMPPELSALILSTVDAAGKEIESRLTLTDLVSLQMNADLVVLSACETGLGEPVYGAGPMAFPAAFLHAGASGVIASLWQVGDSSTAELMTEMYAGLAGGLDPAEALRGAQRLMIDRGDGPYHWAGWVFLGDRNSGN